MKFPFMLNLFRTKQLTLPTLNNGQIFHATAPCITILQTMIDVFYSDAHSADLWKQRCKEVSPLAFLNECCTLKFSLVRQSGHTTAIAFVAGKLENPLIIVWKEVMRKNMVELLKQFGYEHLKNNVLSVSSVENGMTRGMRFSDVIIDTTSLLSQKQLDNIYKEIIPQLSSGKKFMVLQVQ